MTETLILYALAELVFSLTPGPAVFLVLSQSIQKGFTAGAAVTIGIILVNMAYFILSAFGVGAALIASPNVFLALKYVGAAYLAWTGVRTLYELFEARNNKVPIDNIKHEQHAKGIREAFIKGMLTQASNVKNIVIFIAIIPQFIDPNQNTMWQFFALGVVSVLVELPVLILYAIMAAALAVTIRSKGFNVYLDGASAFVLIGISGTLVFSSQI